MIALLFQASAQSPAPVGFFLDFNLLSFILGAVSLIITVLGFFASLKFYRDGVELQKSANDALAKLEEKASALQIQVGGMFEKTLDAAIGNRSIVSDNFEDIQSQLEQLKRSVIDQATQELGVAGQKERDRLSEILSKQLSAVKETVETTRRSVAELAPPEPAASQTSRQAEARVMSALALRGHWLTLTQIARGARLDMMTTRRAVESLLMQGLVQVQLTLFENASSQPDLEGRTYGLTQKGRHAIHSDAY